MIFCTNEISPIATRMLKPHSFSIGRR